MKKLKAFAAVLVILPALVFGQAAEPVDLQMIKKIKMEGFDNSQVMDIAWHLTELYGPRLSGSPMLHKSLEWSRDKLVEWGLENADLEAWGTFGRGWSTEGYSIEMIEPSYVNMTAAPKAWTAGTDGVITGTPVLVNLQSIDDLKEYEGKLGGKIVLLGRPESPETAFEVMASRHDHEGLQDLAMSTEASSRGGFGNSERFRRFRERRALMNSANAMFKRDGVKLLLEASGRNYGVVRLGSGGSRNMGAEPGMPQMVLAVEHYNHLARLLEKKADVKLRVKIENQFHTEDSLGYNVVAEIPGTDRNLKKELVMLGAHIDSWHPGTGATDNASGTSVMMEAVRILKTIDAQPRRTIRIALWTGEEQGLLGSRGYVGKHFGDRRTMELMPDHENFSAYYNMDNGTGRLRGVYMQGNDAVRPIFEAWLRPFHDLDATTLTIRNTGGTDHLAFDAVGLPGFQFIQDPIEYRTRTHHTHLDTYDHLIESDLKQAAVIIASFVYHTAMRDEKLPRKPLPKPRVNGRRTSP